jgi:hypothetical protein
VNPYRSPAPVPVWFVEARVQGPLSSFMLGGVVEALDAQGARERFVREMTDAGFVILSAVNVARWPHRLVSQ